MDFEACYKLLAARPAHAHEHCVDEKHDHAEESITDVQAVAEAVASDLKLEDKQEEAKAREEEIAGIPQLTREFFALQEHRVQIYNDFQDGFHKLKATPQFQSFCTTITMRFADVSKQVNVIESSLRERQRIVLAQLVRKVQDQEKEKLLVTSALLVEKMRLHDMARRPEPDESITALLEKSIGTIKAKHTAIVVEINELLDELRMEVADDEEQDDDE